MARPRGRLPRVGSIARGRDIGLLTEVSVIPLDVNIAPQFVSESLGCLTFRDPYPFLDLVSACLD